MNRKQMSCCLLMAIAGVMAGQATLANQIDWTIDQTASKLTLAIPDQVVNLNGTTLTLQLRNQSGTTATWNQGNTASLAGTIASEYKELSGGPSLQFLSGGTAHGVDSGSYRPNPAAFSPTPSAGNGTYANSSTAPGVFGARARQPFGSDTLNLAYFSFHNVDLALAGTASLAGTNGNYTYAAAQASLGLADTDLAIQGLNALVVGQLFPNTISSISATPTALNFGTATITNLGGLNRKMTIPVSVTNQFDLLGNPVVFAFTGQIVAYAAVPEPSGVVLAGVGMATIMLCGRRRVALRSRR